jgi:putative ABC transport system substrate-binding protein
MLTASFAAAAQPAQRSVTIGYLGNSSPALESHMVEAFREGLRRLGYVEGQNFIIKFKWAEGHQERHPALVREMVRLAPDVILTAGTPGTLAAKQTTQSIPIVTAIAGDAVATGLVASLARPGGNVTGLSTLAPELDGKRLELLKAVVPKLSRVAVLQNPSNPFTQIAWKAMQPAAEVLSVKLEPAEASSPDELGRTLARIETAIPDGLVLIVDRFLASYRASIVHFVGKNRLPGMFPYPEFAREGGLMSYGPDYVDLFRRTATYVDKILKGAKPGDLPMEQPTKFELVINRKTAKALGLKIPEAVLIRADEVIE